MLKTVKCLMPGVEVYLSEEPGVVDPFNSPEYFRGEECFDGSLAGWKRWQKPSPEPAADPVLKEIVLKQLDFRAPYLCAIHDRLLSRIIEQVPAERPILFVSILRAGVFIALGLARRMARRGMNEPPVTAMGLFHEAGFDWSAFSCIMADYPGYFPVFVDGWTGRGVAARELYKSYSEWLSSQSRAGLPETPLLATLIDPGHHGSLFGTDLDTPAPCAHFTAPQVFGFSRAFIKDPRKMWSAYKYPEEYFDHELAEAWLKVFNAEGLPGVYDSGQRQSLPKLLDDLAAQTNTLPGQWKVNINEVVRSFVNRNPRELVICMSPEEAMELTPDLVYLGGRSGIPLSYNPDLGRRHCCLAAVRVK